MAEINDPIFVHFVQHSRFQSTSVVDAIITVDVHSFDASIDSIRLSASFDYFNSDGLLRDFDASNKENVTNFQYTWDGSGNCWDTSDVSFECDGEITRLVVSYDYTQTITSTPFTVGAGLNVPTATINGDVTINYNDFAHFASATLVPTNESPGQLRWVGSGQNAYGAFANFWACDTPNFQEGDMDGDALQDEWEICGYAKDGTVANLPAIGANPKHIDIFVEIDYMTTGPSETESHQPKQSAIDMIVESFNQAPINNPDGTTGIHLHVDNGPASPLVWGPTDTWGSLSKSNSVGHFEFLGPCTAENRYPWASFDVFKNAYFEEIRHPIFHYNLWVHRICSENDVLGLSRNGDLNFDSGASDFVIGLGSPQQAEIFEIYKQAGIFMHELGHNLGLKHGGDDHINYKPNYLSVMNYSFAPKGLIINNSLGHFDYSRYELPALNELALNENHGINIPDAFTEKYGTVWMCGNEFYIRLNAEIVDWDCDDDIESFVQADINNDSNHSLAMQSHDDWSNLVFDGGVVGAYNGTLPTETEIDDITEQDLAQIPYVQMIFLPLITK